jgi:glycerol-3-phosphate dehydrogenase
VSNVVHKEVVVDILTSTASKRKSQHLSDDYGGRAWTGCEYLEPTGERWPLHGKQEYTHVPAFLKWYTPPYAYRTHLLPTVLDAELRHTMHNEHA